MEEKAPKLVNLLEKKSVFDAIVEQNGYDRNQLNRLWDGEITRAQFRAQMSERLKGQWQFGTSSYNIRDSSALCKNACSYCYIGPLDRRFNRTPHQLAIEEIMPTNPKNVAKKWKPVKSPATREMIFFPSSSDIFPEMVADYVRVAESILLAGHEIMFVSKMSLAMANEMTKRIAGWSPEFKSRFRPWVTITSNGLLEGLAKGNDGNKSSDIARQFEPFAPPISERITAALQFARAGFILNIMVEPYLTDPVGILEMLRTNLINPGNGVRVGVIAIGGMNYMPGMKFSPNLETDAKLRGYLDELYSEKNLLALWEYVRHIPGVFLKKHTYDQIARLKKK